MNFLVVSIGGYGWDWSSTMKPTDAILLWFVCLVVEVVANLLMKHNLKNARYIANKKRENKQRISKLYPYFNSKFIYKQFFLGLNKAVSKLFVISIFVAKITLLICAILVVCHLFLINYEISLIIRIFGTLIYFCGIYQIIYSCSKKIKL